MKDEVKWSWEVIFIMVNMNLFWSMRYMVIWYDYYCLVLLLKIVNLILGNFLWGLYLNNYLKIVY